MPRKITTIAIDDEQGALRAISSIIKSLSHELELVGTADSIEAGYALIQKVQPELVFLDIQLKDKTGFDLLIMPFDYSFEVIFATAYDEYALKAFKAQALSYLLKPVDIDDFNSAVRRATSIIRSSAFDESSEVVKQLRATLKGKIAVHVGQETEYVVPQDIAYIKASGSYSELHLTNGDKRIVSKNLKHFELLLVDHGFVRPHRSYLLNANLVKKTSRADGGFAELSNGKSIPLTKDGREMLERLIG